MTKSILLTGGFGNVGGRFSGFLNENGIKSVRLSSRTLRTPPNWAPLATTVECDLRDPKSLKRACEGVETIFHFAALNDRECLEDPQRAHDVNVVGTENLINAAVSEDVQHIVYMSTIHVYGNPLVGHLDETSPTNPTHPYGITHLAAEDVLRDRSSEISSTIIRSGNGFGYPMTRDVNIWHIIVNDLCMQAVKNRDLVLKSPANIERNFVTLRDICRALYFVGFEIDPQNKSVVFNLGSRRSRTLREMADIISSRCSHALGFTPEIIELSPLSNEETNLNFDSTRIRNSGFPTDERFEEEIDGILHLLTEKRG